MSIADELETAINEVSEALSELEWKNYLPQVQEKLRNALKSLTTIANFYTVG